jgi:hypothetical protein
MKVFVCFEFPSIQDLNGPEADEVVANLTEFTVRAQETLREEGQQVDVWVDEAREDTFTGNEALMVEAIDHGLQRGYENAVSVTAEGKPPHKDDVICMQYHEIMHLLGINQA